MEDELPDKLTVDCIRYRLFHAHNDTVYVSLRDEVLYWYPNTTGTLRTRVAALRHRITNEPTHRERTRRIHVEKVAAQKYARRRNGDA